ncbi:shikimate dehydrogenase [Rheinheimera maricola]|uniref:Shikimate dehydrogenase (NADP(+)) n=1 Tax=Rheinheimera maricola TaxID=2793282 RepID=A0ABS7XCP8_9GAMM|nr:shikimate dehydrogenase [Rheinheimera maricola]
MDRYAVFGNPIRQSKSPLIHTQFATQCAELLSYEAILAPVDGFADSWRAFVKGGGKGGNVTAPFKQQAYQLADVLSERALQAGAVNTLYIDSNGRLHGDNTDGIGLVADLQRLGVDLPGCAVLLLGAGGASRGVIGPLLNAGVQQLVLANRTQSKAQLIAESFTNTVYACGFAEIPNKPYQLVINATSSALSNERPDINPSHLQHCLLAYDLSYSSEPTAFMQWSAKHGALRQADGLGMLVSQAAEAFYIWRGKRPDVTPVLALLQQQLKAR